MASEERRTISTEELIKELGSAVWNYGTAGRDNIIKKYGVEAYEAAQTAIHEEVREKARREAEERDKRRGRIMCIVSVLALISALAIFPPDAPVNDAEPTERDIKVAFMAEAIERKTRAAMIESSEG